MLNRCYVHVYYSILFTITKLWEQSRCPQLMKELRKVVFIYNGILFNYKEE
jgi:hypothetical protein